MAIEVALNPIVVCFRARYQAELFFPTGLIGSGQCPIVLSSEKPSVKEAFGSAGRMSTWITPAETEQCPYDYHRRAKKPKKGWE
ncbi:MAG: hypothetical protein A2758_03195 [Candidatus Zambryskibacteria bacterium RIFCSPHIGHO2_01_FULL_49_18]|uniref:Uncharacterized protein n=1 Tax=Candidatus Zambryskibacteria bacterium RIFCSPHIGHO2_01_FULL_49_18 TaxID=1802740 RepID=A0A1G2T3A7_9BACT|nr:MAG: hypothetical protein A2758_03195 [Candidatus Zambryskibacteria bacterium RIFCSPHIGHO2_01_FULL_49_18]